MQTLVQSSLYGSLSALKLHITPETASQIIQIMVKQYNQNDIFQLPSWNYRIFYNYLVVMKALSRETPETIRKIHLLQDNSHALYTLVTRRLEMLCTLSLTQQQTALILTSLMIHIYYRIFKSFEIVKSDLLLHTTSPHNLGMRMILDNWQQRRSDTDFVAFCQFIDGLILEPISESLDYKLVIKDSELTGFILCATCSLCKKNIWIERPISVNAIIQDGNVVNLQAIGQSLITYINEPVATNITKYIDWQIILDLDYIDAVVPYVTHIQDSLIHRIQQLVAAAPRYWKEIGSRYMSLINTDKLSFPIIKYLTQIANSQSMKLPQHWELQDFKWVTPEIWAISQFDRRLSTYILGLPLHLGVPGPKTIYKSLCLLKRLGVEQYTRHMCIQGSHLILPTYHGELLERHQTCIDTDFSGIRFEDYGPFDRISYIEDDHYFEFTRPHFNGIINTKQNPYTKKPINGSDLLVEMLIRQNMASNSKLPEATSLETVLRRYLTPMAQVVNSSSAPSFTTSPYVAQACVPTMQCISTSINPALSRIIPIFTSSSPNVSYSTSISTLPSRNGSSLQTNLLSHMDVRNDSNNSNHFSPSVYIPIRFDNETPTDSSTVKPITANTLTTLTHNSVITESLNATVNSYIIGSKVD